MDANTLALNEYLAEQEANQIAYDNMLEEINDDLSGKLLDIKKEFSAFYKRNGFNEGENDLIEWIKEIV